MVGRQLRLRARCGVGHSAVRVNGADGARLVPSRSGDTTDSALEWSVASCGCGRAAEWDTPRSESTEQTERGLSQAAAGTQWTALWNGRSPAAAAGALRSGTLRGPSQRSKRK